MMDDEQLKPCPFCGGAAIFEQVEAKLYPGRVTWTIGCSNSEVDCIATQMLSTYSRKNEAAEAWNRRAT